MPRQAIICAVHLGAGSHRVGFCLPGGSSSRRSAGNFDAGVLEFVDPRALDANEIVVFAFADRS
jgi:hypothetical protein